MKNLISLLVVLYSTQALSAAIESARCADRSDSLATEAAIGRTHWAFKCYPSIRLSMPGKKVELLDAATGALVLGYPSFGVVNENGEFGGFWTAPTDPNASCEGATTKYSFLGFCKAGCYTPDQELLYSDGYAAIDQAMGQGKQDIVTLARHATMGNVLYRPSSLKSYTVDPEEKQQTILEIRTTEGGVLKVTTNHPLVVSTGDMKEAHELKVGEQLVNEEGSFSEISSIVAEQYFGKVYNVEMGTNNISDNIVVAQGYLNGSVMFQNATVKEVNRQVLRTNLPISLFQ